MPILFSAVIKDTLILAKSASVDGNFAVVLDQILKKIPPHDEKQTLRNGRTLYHYISENRLVYLCITDDKFLQAKAFTFLADIKKKFLETFDDTPSVAIPYAVLHLPSQHGEFSQVLETEMAKYNKIGLPKLKEELEDLKNIMVQNVERMARRGDQLDTLLDRTDGLATSSTTFRSTAVQVKRKYWWQNIKLWVITVVVTVLLAYLIGAWVCGGFTWKTCVG